MVFWGLFTHNPALIPGKTHTSKNWPIFSLCRWKWGESAACGQARLWQPNGPQCAKSHATWQSLSSRLKNCGFLKKIFSHFLKLYFLVFFSPFLRCWPCVEAGILFGSFSSIRLTKSSVGCRKNPYFENWPICGRYGHTPGTGARFSNAVWGVPGSYAGDTSYWILPLWFIVIVFVFGSGLLPHTRTKTLKNTVF